MKNQSGFISESDFWTFTAIMIVLGFALGGVVFIGLPKLWELLKPLIHAWSA
jgi:hypothetical protein